MSNLEMVISVDEDLKKRFEEFCDIFDIDSNKLFNQFMRKVVQNYKVPFSVGAEVFNDDTCEVFTEVEWMEDNPDMCVTYYDVKEMMREVLNGDVWD